jgi:hypothetical protein
MYFEYNGGVIFTKRGGFGELLRGSALNSKVDL